MLFLPFMSLPLLSLLLLSLPLLTLSLLKTLSEDYATYDRSQALVLKRSSPPAFLSEDNGTLFGDSAVMTLIIIVMQRA